nr:hypothetical protein [Tanacetum cinerariifolium]
MSSSTVTYTSVYTDSEPERVPGPEHPPSLDYVPGPEHPPLPVEVLYVLEPEYPEYLVPSEDKAPIEDQPLPTDALPTALSPGYVADSDPDEDPEEDHADYPGDGGDGDDEPSDDDDDDDDTDDEEEEPFEDEDDDDEEEEHLASTDSFIVTLLTLFPQLGIQRHLRLMSLHLHLDHLRLGTDIHKAKMPPRKRACFTTPTLGLEVRESSAAGAARQPGPIIVKAMLEIVPTTLEGVNQKVTELATTIRQDTKEFQVRFEDNRTFLRARVNTLFKDRRYHCHTVMLFDREATYARRAWISSEDRSATIEAHVRTLEAHVATLISQTSSL